MTTIEVKALRDPAAPPRPRCEATLSISTQEFWHGRGRPGNKGGDAQCGNAASYRIGRKTYCGRHAAIRALDLAVEYGGIQAIDVKELPHES